MLEPFLERMHDFHTKQWSRGPLCVQKIKGKDSETGTFVSK